MNWANGLDKLHDLSLVELNHKLYLINTEIASYTKAIKNYSPAKMAKYGLPYMKKLTGHLSDVEKEINSRKPKPILGPYDCPENPGCGAHNRYGPGCSLEGERWN